MKVVGVATTYPAPYLRQAHLVLPSLEEFTLDRLEALFEARDYREDGVDERKGGLP